jgi:plastocyanin
MQKTIPTLICGLLAILLIVPTASAEGWGSIKGRFVVDGTPPKLTPLVVNKDQYCINKMPKNDSVVIGKDHALVNAVVYLRLPLGATVDVNPEYAAELKKPAVLDNKGCSFSPHILTVRKGQELKIVNSDPVSHNTNITLLSFNPIVPAGTSRSVEVTTDRSLPTPVQCNIHTWMKGYLLAQDHPYMAVSGEDGTFEIKDIPAGKHEFQFWHEAPGYLKNLKFKGGTTDRRGRAKITIVAGKTIDLGDITVPASMLVER